jgi:hypothetical protein
MDRVIIKEIRPATLEEWDRIWICCDYGTFFHSREWAEIWNEYTNGYNRPYPHIVIFSDSKSALLPFTLQIRKKTIKNFFLSAEGQFGNWISETELTKDHVECLIKYLSEEFGNLVWRWNPYDPSVVHISPDCLSMLDCLYMVEEDETYAVSLTCGFDGVFDGCCHGHQCSFRKATKEGLSFALAETEEEWKEYYLVYLDSLRRWGESALSKIEWDFFHKLFRRDSPYIKLWLARDGSLVIAGALCFYSKKHIVCWHAASLEKYFSKRPMNFLFMETMRDGCANGYSWFDFNTSAHLDGVKTFKKRFGASELKCNVFYKKIKPVQGYITLKNFYKKILG